MERSCLFRHECWQSRHGYYDHPIRIAPIVSNFLFHKYLPIPCSPHKYKKKVPSKIIPIDKSQFELNPNSNPLFTLLSLEMEVPFRLHSLPP